MLKASASQRGFNIIEILVTLAVLGVLVALGAPSLAEFLQNQQIRAAAESTVNGLQVARGEAIKRNLAVQFALEIPDSELKTGWTICDGAWFPCDSTTLTTNPDRVIQARSPEEGTSIARIQQTPSTTIAVTFSPLGSVLAQNSDGTAPLTRLDFVKNVPNSCIADGGSMRCLRVVVSGGGSIRMCDPTPGIAFPDPRACP